MASTIVFACKSNSCRSQMAEGWAKNWITNERSKLDARRRSDITAEGDNQEQVQSERRLQSFLDGLVVASVALDESSVTSSIHDVVSLSSSPRSSLTSFFTKNNTSNATNSTSCVTCDGEICAYPLRRKKVKEKAVEAMAIDGVDISDAIPKTIDDVLSSSSGSKGEEQLFRGSKSRSFSLLEILRRISLQTSLAYAGVAAENESEPGDVGADTSDEQRSVDSLVVLCACADSLKRKLSGMSKETFEWDIDAPTALAKEGEGDMAYLRVSRQIRVKVETFMDRLKESVMNGNLDCCLNNKSKSCNIEQQAE